MPGREFHPLKAPGLAWRTVGRKRPRALAFVAPRHLPVLSGRCHRSQAGIALVPLPPSEPGVQIFRTGLPKISLSRLDCSMDHLGLG